MGEFAPPADTTIVETIAVDVVADYDDELDVGLGLAADPLLDVDLDTAID